jgi:hypothetical protein
VFSPYSCCQPSSMVKISIPMNPATSINLSVMSRLMLLSNGSHVL